MLTPDNYNWANPSSLDFNIIGDVGVSQALGVRCMFAADGFNVMGMYAQNVVGLPPVTAVMLAFTTGNISGTFTLYSRAR